MNKLIQDFEKLSFGKKREKLLLILEGLKNNHPIFAKLSKVINSKNINENFLTGIYSDIINFGKNIKEKRNINFEQKMKKIIDKIHEQENIERDQENPDNLINFIS